MCVGIVDYVTRDLNNRPGAPELMRELVREGKLGAKAGRGFYDWSSKSADEVKGRRDAFLIDVLRRRKQQ
jgi:3-hydroxybutyryl-CoA dehydrogenase